MSPGYAAPAYGYGCGDHHDGCNNFAIIVVLFILLIIIGACAFSGYKG
ncbi:YjcZ family sporulation protein [Priestia endophytica]|nr:YjcZ family sporulation protein [Priestia endophytica]